MKRLNVQIQPDLSPLLDMKQAVERLRQLGRNVQVTEGNDDGRYINVDFQAYVVSQLWEEVEAVVRDVPGMSDAVIVACEGDRGWTDYHMLYHFEASVHLDCLD